jgi:ribosomal protein S18 acetylase RimI-like enzyme
MQWKTSVFVTFYSALNPYAFVNNVPMTSQIKSIMKASHDVDLPHTTRTYYVRDAKQSDLSQVADVLMLSFTPQVNDPIRKMFEICRLQTTFPTPGYQHLFLVACESGHISQDNGTDDEERIIGFIKVDGREATDMHKTLVDTFPQFMDQLPKTPYATDLAVHPNYRRRGVAKEIMCEVELRVRNWAVESLFLGVEADNLHALDMYKHMGYEIFIKSMRGERDGCVHLLRRNLKTENSI